MVLRYYRIDAPKELKRHCRLALLVKKELLTDDIVSLILSQQHSGFSVWLGEPFEDQDSSQFVARYKERGPVSLQKLTIQYDIVTYQTKDGVAHEFDALEFLAQLSAHIPKPYESLTRYYARYSSRTRGERIKAAHGQANDVVEEGNSDESPAHSTWAILLKRIYEIDPIECPLSVYQPHSQGRAFTPKSDPFSIGQDTGR